MPQLSFEQFSKANEARKKQFFKGSSVYNWSIADAFMAMIGELGETANALKKVRRAELGMLNKNEPGRQIDSLDDAKAKVAGEIGGFMCYLDQLCVQIGLRLEDCIVDEFNKKSEELGLPERIIGGRFYDTSAPAEVTKHPYGYVESNTHVGRNIHKEWHYQNGDDPHAKLHGPYKSEADCRKAAGLPEQDNGRIP